MTARTCTAVERATAAIRPDAAAARCRSAGPPLTALAASGFDIADLARAAAATVLSHAARVRDGAAFDLGFFAQIRDRHAVQAATLAHASAATHAALEHLATAVRDAAAYDALVVARLGDARCGLWAGVFIRIADARIAQWLASVDDGANARVLGERKRPAATSGNEPPQEKR